MMTGGKPYLHASAGYRLEVKAQGVDVLLLWYRNQIYAIEQRCGFHQTAQRKLGSIQ
jgi:nitrite reductase/ring-hydroxylating ferredoxin subunit